MINKIDENYTIITDVELDNFLCEYFNVNDIIFNFVPKGMESIPLIDQIISKTNDKKILLIIGIKTLLKLCDQKSKYNNFLNLINSNKIKLIYYELADSCFEIDGKGPFSLVKKYFDSRGNDVVEKIDDIHFFEKINDILKELKFVWWGDVRFGKYMTKHFKNAEFYNLHNPFIHICNLHHFFYLKKNKEKTNTFFSLIKSHRGRIHRNILMEKIQYKDYIKNAIVNFSSPADGSNILSDMEAEYGNIYLKQKIVFPTSYPVPSYYEKTYFELVCETMGAIRGDDTFYFSEKSFKTIAMGHPFIILSTKHFLRNLRELGFKTFGDFIDESYDECDSIEDKVEIISKNLERLDMDKSRKFYEDSRAIREHNQNHLMYLYGRYKFDLWNKWNNFFKGLK